MATALDYNPVSNKRGLKPYQFTDWQRVFQPRLSSVMQPQLGDTVNPQSPIQGPSYSGSPIQTKPDALNRSIWEARQQFRQANNQKSSLWNVSDAPQQQKQPALNSVTDMPPQNGNEDWTQPQQEPTSDGITSNNTQSPLAFDAAPGTNRSFTPNGITQQKSISSQYGTASVSFDPTTSTAGVNNFFAKNNRAPFAGGGVQLRF